jgi:hypothetical protein
MKVVASSVEIYKGERLDCLRGGALKAELVLGVKDRHLRKTKPFLFLI